MTARLDLDGLVCQVESINIRTEKYKDADEEVRVVPATDIAFKVIDSEGDRLEKLIECFTMRDTTAAKRWLKDAGKMCGSESFISKCEDHRVELTRAHAEMFDGELEHGVFGGAKVNKFNVNYDSESGQPEISFRVQCQVSGDQVAPAIDLLNQQVAVSVRAPGSNQ